MTVRRIKTKQGKHSCSWCDRQAIYRGYGWGKCSCAAHQPELQDWDRKAQAPDHSDAQFYAGY